MFIENVLDSFKDKKVSEIIPHHFSCVIKFTDGSEFKIIPKIIKYPALNDQQLVLKYVIDNEELPKE